MVADCNGLQYPAQFTFQPAHTAVYNPRGTFSLITLFEWTTCFCQDPGDEKDNTSFYTSGMYTGKRLEKDGMQNYTGLMEETILFAITIKLWNT